MSAEQRARLVALLQRGCWLPAARDLATLLLRIADRRHAAAKESA